MGDKEKEETENAGAAVGESGEDGESGAEPRPKENKKAAKRKVRGGGVEQKNVKNDEQKTVARCKCGKLVKDDSEGGVECDICGMWLHPKCEGLNKECYAAIKNHALFWICGKCKTYCGKFKEVVAGETDVNQSRKDIVEIERIDKIEEKLTELGEAMNHIAASIIGQKDVMMEIGSMVKAQGDEKNSFKDIETTVKNAMKEENMTYADITKNLQANLRKKVFPNLQSRSKTYKMQ